MMYRILFALSLITSLIFNQILPLNAKEVIAPLFPNLGNFTHSISSKNTLAQTYFDQGMLLSYGFNHAEAARSFEEATRQDPNCAICYWGLALVLGPNINAPMDESVTQKAWNAIKKAQELSQNASESEKDYISALSYRYLQNPPEDRHPLDVAYAEAMAKVAQKYPEDLDAATLYAEALMDTTPWDYWEENGTPKPEGTKILNTLEAVLAGDPNHPGANHLYIHAVEKEKPEMGVISADRLRDLVPGSGHLSHMPSHIYIRVGRYHDANLANQRAIAADLDYTNACHAQGMYPLVYMPHNQHFLWFGAIMNGQSAIALQAAQETAKVNKELLHHPDLGAILQHYYSIPLYTFVRFAKWDDILAVSAPESDLSYPLGVWHYARGMALVNKGQIKEAKTELSQLQEIAAIPQLKDQKIFGLNSTSSILDIANTVLTAEIATAEGDDQTAIAQLQKGIKIEDNLVYTEPADWYHPVRQILGEKLTQKGEFSAAEAIYRQDLEIYPDNGWSLYGLAQSLSAQGKTQEAEQVKAKFQDVWQYADTQASLNSLD